MNSYLLIKTANLVAFAYGTWDDWKETFALFKEDGIEIDSRKFSDYSGPSVPCDQLLYYHFSPNECPAALNRNIF